MKKILLFVFVLISTQVLLAQCNRLYIAGSIDGPLSGGTPKAIQFCATDDIADLSIYGFGSANNGGGSDGEEFTFPAETVSAGDCFWVNSSSNYTNFNTWFGFDPCYDSGAASINGDDAIELFCNGSVEDLFGDINVDGTGECWEHLDGWAKAADAVPSTSFDCADWTFSGPNALDGESDNASAASPYPNPGPQNCPSVPLNIILSSFSAKPIDRKSIELNWSTASEENNDYFSIQHSTDGRNFTELGWVEGAGTTFAAQEYHFMHKEAEKGMNYYRLQQFDFDGTFAYSPVEVVELAGIAEIEVRPTLAENTVDVLFSTSLDRNATLEVINIMGKTVIQEAIGAQTEKLQLDVSTLHQGHYFVRMQVGNEIKTTRFIKI